VAGTLAGLGRLEFAAVRALGVLSANLILRPMAHRINRTPVQKEEHEILVAAPLYLPDHG
jgi:uncharacterized membrane protein YhiD involved in acid resistance